MTKRDLVVKIARETGFIQNDVAEVKSRKGRNPNQPKNEVIIPERAVVKFRAGKELKEAVEKLNPAQFK